MKLWIREKEGVRGEFNYIVSTNWRYEIEKHRMEKKFVLVLVKFLNCFIFLGKKIYKECLVMLYKENKLF